MTLQEGVRAEVDEFTGSNGYSQLCEGKDDWCSVRMWYLLVKETQLIWEARYKSYSLKCKLFGI